MMTRDKGPSTNREHEYTNGGNHPAGAASAATFPSSKTRGWALPERLPSQPLRHRRREVRGESPSYRNHLFVGAALAATLASSRTGGWELSERLSLRPLRHRGRRFGAKAPPTGGSTSVGAALAATFPSSRTEVQSYQSGFRRDLCVIEDKGVRGESPSYKNRFS